jgi:hypothetical protein
MRRCSAEYAKLIFMSRVIWRVFFLISRCVLWRIPQPLMCCKDGWQASGCSVAPCMVSLDDWNALCGWQDASTCMTLVLVVLQLEPKVNDAFSTVSHEVNLTN